MKDIDINNRKNNYNLLNSKLPYLSNDKIKKIISTDKTDKVKWGLNKVITFNKIKIFIKAIPITDLFIESNSSNLYKIPAFYNYGYGSAGINPWREVLLHIKTTNFVLHNKCHNFPLLYHYRIIKDNNNNFNTGLEDKLLNRWNNNKNIIKYLKDRSNAQYKIVLFLEYIPNVAWSYLQKNPNFIESFYNETKKIVTFLNKNKILHNDAHLGNFLIDSTAQKNIYITDFGLSLDAEFDLDKDEITFMKMNKKLDILYTINNVMSNYINKCKYNKKIEKKYELKQYESAFALLIYLINNIDKVAHDIKMNNFEYNFIKLYINKIIRYRKWKKEFILAKNKKNYFLNSL